MVVELQSTKEYERIADRIEEMIVDSGMKPGNRRKKKEDFSHSFSLLIT